MSVHDRSTIHTPVPESSAITRSLLTVLLLHTILCSTGCRESPKPGLASAHDSSEQNDELHDTTDSVATDGSVVGIDISSVEIDSVRDDLPSPFSIDISHPHVFARSGGEKLAALNDAVRREVETIMATFLEQVDEFQPGEDFGMSSSLSLRYDVAMINPRCVSVELVIDEYYAGAAHPNARSITMNYDVEQETLLSFASLFDDDSIMLARISKLTSDHLLQIPDMDSAWIAEGTKAVEENYEGFLLTPENLVILFNPYQVAPYAMGPQRVGIPWQTVGKNAHKQIRHLLGASRTSD